jgi:hypothetical protein
MTGRLVRLDGGGGGGGGSGVVGLTPERWGRRDDERGGRA